MRTTRQEAIAEIKYYMEHDSLADAPSNGACQLAIAALRGPTRETMERIFPGCHYCKPDSDGYVRKFGAYSIQNGELETGHCKPQKINFCPHCSRPLTAEAVDMMLERMEVPLNEVYGQ